MTKTRFIPHKPMIYSFAALLIMMTLHQCASSQHSDIKPNEFTYLALGDSYTIGESVASKNCWPNLLVDALAQQKMVVHSTTIIAKTGWRTDEMLNAAEREVASKKYNMVSLLIGVNNEFQGQDPTSFEREFIESIRYTIAHCKTGASGVFVVSIPDYGYTPYGARKQKKISERIDAYNEICERISNEYRVPFYNITPISRKGLDQPTIVASDGLHPSGKQYTLWVEQFSNAVYQLFNP